MKMTIRPNKLSEPIFVTHNNCDKIPKTQQRGVRRVTSKLFQEVVKSRIKSETALTHYSQLFVF